MLFSLITKRNCTFIQIKNKKKLHLLDTVIIVAGQWKPWILKTLQIMHLKVFLNKEFSLTFPYILYNYIIPVYFTDDVTHLLELLVMVLASWGGLSLFEADSGVERSRNQELDRHERGRVSKNGLKSNADNVMTEGTRRKQIRWVWAKTAKGGTHLQVSNRKSRWKDL